MAPLDVDLILPSHGGPFRGHRERIQATTAHHAMRCDQIVALITRQPRTAHALVEEMWKGKLSPFHHHFAVFEVLAHLEYLERRGRVVAAALGLTVHPFLWFIVIVAAIWLFARRGSWSRR